MMISKNAHKGQQEFRNTKTLAHLCTDWLLKLHCQLTGLLHAMGLAELVRHPAIAGTQLARAAHASFAEHPAGASRLDSRCLDAGSELKGSVTTDVAGSERGGSMHSMCCSCLLC